MAKYNIAVSIWYCILCNISEKKQLQLQQKFELLKNHEMSAFALKTAIVKSKVTYDLPL